MDNITQQTLKALLEPMVLEIVNNAINVILIAKAQEKIDKDIVEEIVGRAIQRIERQSAEEYKRRFMAYPEERYKKIAEFEQAKEMWKV